MTKKKNEALGIVTPSTIKTGSKAKAIRVFIRNPARYSIRAQWVPEISDKLNGTETPKPKRFANLDEAVTYFKSIGHNIGRDRIRREWVENKRYELKCGAVLVGTVYGPKMTNSKILVEWPKQTMVSVESKDQTRFKKMILDGVCMTFTNVACFVNFCAGMGIELRNYRALNRALVRYGATVEVPGVAVLTCEPIITYGTSAKGNKQITTNTKYRDIVNKLDRLKGLGVDPDRILASKV